METRRLKPARRDGRVAKPGGGYLAKDGEAVVFTNYWARRVRSGDVVEAKKKAGSRKGSGSSTSTTPKE